MSDERSGAVDAASGSWASESLPLSVRKELLQRELRKLRLRRAQSRSAASAQGGPPLQQQAQSPQRPQAADAGEA